MGGDPGTLSELLAAGVKIIVYVSIIAIFGAIVLSVVASIVE